MVYDTDKWFNTFPMRLPCHIKAKILKKLGFQEEGVQRAVYFKDGRFVDALMMAMLFNDVQ
jgi:L-amino acid N-acyltransferase YncA